MNIKKVLQKFCIVFAGNRMIKNKTKQQLVIICPGEISIIIMEYPFDRSSLDALYNIIML